MSFHDTPVPPVPVRKLMLVDVERGSYHELALSAGEQSSGNRPVPGVRKSPEEERPYPEPVRGGADPWQIAHDWPERWRDYLHAHFRSYMAVAQAFQVSEKAARKWWEGVGSCRGDKAAVACALHPESAPRMLFGLDAHRMAAE